MPSIWVLKESFESILTPKSLSCVILFISLFSTIKLIFFLILQIKLHLSGFDFIWLSPNHWNSMMENLSIIETVFLRCFVVWLSTLLHRSRERMAYYHQRNLLIQCFSLSRRDHKGKYWIGEALIQNPVELQIKFLLCWS